MIAMSTMLNGVLLGGLYALYGLGLSLTFGIMRTVNLAHGDIIVLATYLALITTQVLGLTPLMSLAVLVPVMFCIGYGLQRLILNRTLKDGMMPAVIITFGLSFVIQNGLLLGFSADRQVLRQGAIETMGVTLAPGVTIGVFPILTLAVLLVMIFALQAFMGRTLLGRAFRATSDDPATAELMGIDGKRIYGLAMGLSFAIIAVTGVVMGIRSNFSPFDGPARLIFAFEVIIIGGMGSIYGVLAGGLILGIAQTIGGAINPTFFQLAGHLVTLGILVVRPSGLFPETIERD
ncbi:MAG: branched-chain amino acid ABC transporter permease [Alphaproteobacteria bacterium]|jgi:branched-chain amino acid transport system permease protein|uniref:Branched-chain amino acid transport system permease protein n=1 Tax=Celeribacter baekdonensis TaxID=875171 RepID=A0A1G7U0Z1_9RHOB|nr:branched-chain amino acid ABC transporter permease [Celeribacter baekdonensis]MBU0644690.1 branched-chain amino acid ABC transporter permease [Alphaproteobacteria bacterium]MBU1281610.1 branched-chain amino acid ABC transporter permease [Alphaproteobacteria bacterium]MBU1573439.1 branched-chain amino acid ABC transporter permease [Alphaproteobacteria bacterium]MBU1828216.1 branched-chain amino acid ABC transporter permease [Alphaproteobacteria bacterium]MBU2077716.1 branched-chain amino aci